jgi:sulfur dioxygenase
VTTIALFSSLLAFFLTQQPSFELANLTGSKLAMHVSSPAPKVHLHVKDGDTVYIGDMQVKIMHVPGHTPDSIALYLPEVGHLYSGDTILIGGTGRTDFAGGDPAQSYDSIQRMFQLPDDTIMWPGHDYRGYRSSTIGHEKRTNPRAGGGKSRDEYIGIMNNLGLPLPEKIMEALQLNISAVEDTQMKLPTISELIEIHQLEAQKVAELIQEPGERPIIVDVREPSEFEGEHIPGSINLPLLQLTKRYQELEQFKGQDIICVCRAGVRSTTAAALLTGFGFPNVKNMRGGMLAWQKLNVS